MLKKRVIPVMLLKDGRVVKTTQFANPRDVGDPVSQARIHNNNGADELMILNIQPDKGVQPLLDVIEEIGKVCFIPVAVGGGIRTEEDAATLIKAGAEKVVIRTMYQLIPAIAEHFGQQAVVWCYDYAEPVKELGDMGAGEVVLHATDRDGIRKGYDVQTISNVRKSLKCPIIAMGGCGHYQHMVDAFNAGADACASGAMFAFTDSNPFRARAYLRSKGIPVRYG
jgi:cyclase